MFRDRCNSYPECFNCNYTSNTYDESSQSAFCEMQSSLVLQYIHLSRRFVGIHLLRLKLSTPQPGARQFIDDDEDDTRVPASRGRRRFCIHGCSRRCSHEGARAHGCRG